MLSSQIPLKLTNMMQNPLTVVYTIYEGRLLIENPRDFCQKSNLKSQLCRSWFRQVEDIENKFCHQARRLLELLMLPNAVHMHLMFRWAVGFISGDSKVADLSPQNQPSRFSGKWWQMVPQNALTARSSIFRACSSCYASQSSYQPSWAVSNVFFYALIWYD